MMRGDNHIFQGMKRDTHPIRQKDEFLWEAHNVRLTNRDSDTLLSITNERGTSDTKVSFNGIYVGHCTVGHYLVIFTAEEDESNSYIYRIEKDSTGLKKVTLYEGSGLGLSPYNPIEAIASYETEFIQKVYWVDGKHQPRMINVALPNFKLSDEEYKEKVVDGANLTSLLGYNHNSFDFVQELNLREKVYVRRNFGFGTFSPGTIQYAFSYFNKYGQESSIFYTTPLSHISYTDRGGSPEDKVACNFEITIENIQQTFDYLRVYSIHRTSIDAVPTVCIVRDIPVPKGGTDTVVCVDDGTTSDTIDPTQLLYTGGESIIASTIHAKDGTLFLGDITLSSYMKPPLEYDSDESRDNAWNHFKIKPFVKSIGHIPNVGAYYRYASTLGDSSSSFFKTNEVYRVGLQFQHKSGKWSSPVWLGDQIVNDTYPEVKGTTVSIPLATLLVDYGDKLNQIKEQGFIKVRPCVVLPRVGDRKILCQGVLCPTVFNTVNRKNNSPYSQASWFFRPVFNYSDNSDADHGAMVQFKHDHTLFGAKNRGAEIQSMDLPIPLSISSVSPDEHPEAFLVNENILTMNSPDIEFDTSFWNLDLQGVKLNIVGRANLTASIGDIDVRTSSPTLGGTGFYHRTIGNSIHTANYGTLVSGLFYNDLPIDKDFHPVDGATRYWMIYPWHGSGSLNNDRGRPADTGIQSAVLSKKVISNLKFFSPTKFIDYTMKYDISTPIMHSSDELSVDKIELQNGASATYCGNIDTLLSTTNDYNYYTGYTFNQENLDILSALDFPEVDLSKNPIRMKYKSTPHIAFSLYGEGASAIELLPRYSGFSASNDSNYSIPDWANPNSTSKSPSFTLLYSIYKKEAPNDELGLNEYHYDYNKKKLYLRGPNGKDTDVTASSSGLILKLEAHKSYYQLDGEFGLDSGGKLSKYTGETKYFKVKIGHLNNTTTRICTLVPYTPTNTSESTDKKFILRQKSITNEDQDETPYLLIGELVREFGGSFGGKTKEALEHNLWIPAGEPVLLEDPVIFGYGDTWYQRYDCLKTYPFTQEDENQIVEIGSFMIETRINIDGRYDRNRGQLSNLNMSPQNFNLINEVYSQSNNFFTSRVVDDDLYKQSHFPNQLTWSLQKNSGEVIDPWTHITMANTLDLDGSKGKVVSIKSFNGELLSLQEKSINQILFNSRVQIPSSDGVPIEISNGYKVDGSRPINDNIGCQDKSAIITSQAGLYFVDYNTDSIWRYNGQLENLSDSLGMRQWVVENNHHKVWTPAYTTGYNGIKASYDSKNGDVYFIPGESFISNKYIYNDALCFSERLGQFTSLMSYGGAVFIPFEDKVYSVTTGYGRPNKLWENFTGQYNNIYGEFHPFSISFISNSNPEYTKIFDTIEIEADSYLYSGYNSYKSTPDNKCPFNFIKVENEYQNGSADILNGSRNMIKKFRIWRGIIPRNRGTRERIRNPWSSITIGFDPNKMDKLSDKARKVVVHNTSVKYTI